MRVISSTPVSISMAKKILEAREKEGELGYEQQQALEHAKKFEKMDPEKSEKLIETITKKFENINRETAVKLVDILPKKPETVKAILFKDRIDLPDDKIAELIALLG